MEHGGRIRDNHESLQHSTNVLWLQPLQALVTDVRSMAASEGRDHLSQSPPQVGPALPGRTAVRFHTEAESCPDPASPLTKPRST